MKKTLAIFLSLFCVITIFGGCKDFFNGLEFQTKLEDSISYVSQEPFTIRFSEKGGKISPSGDQTCRITDQFSLIFNEDREMCFLNWQVLLNGELLEPETAANYIWFENTESPETKIEIKARVENLVVQANVVKRPAIIKVSPQSDESGVYRDRTVVIQFNQDINEEAIYFTADELAELGVSTANAFPVESGSNYYYAYWDGHDENTYTFKNITITNYQFLNVNYLKYFDVPKLDSGNKKILRISTKVDYSTNPAISIAPPSATEILVTVSKNIYTKNGKKTVSLSDDYGWTYFTNGSTDITPPEFVTTDAEGFVVTAADEGQTAFNENKPSETTNNFIKTPINDLDTAALNKLVKLNAKNKKLWLRGSFIDEGSGPSRLGWKLYKVKTALYPFTAEEEAVKQTNSTTHDEEICIEENGQFDDFEVAGQKASFKPNINSSQKDMGGTTLELAALSSEGTYRIDFTAYDKNNRPSNVKSFYFVYDAESSFKNDNTYRILYKNNEYYIKSDNYHWYYATKINGTQLSSDGILKIVPENANNEVTLNIVEEDCYGNFHNSDTKTFKLVQPSVGMIYYGGKYNWWSPVYESDYTPIGIICDVSADLKKIRIWDLVEQGGYIWGDQPPHSDNGGHYDSEDGLACLNIYINSFSNSTINYTRENVHTYFWWILNVKRNGSSVDWYIPTGNELVKYIAANYTVLQNTYNLLNANGVSATIANAERLLTCVPNTFDNNTVQYFLSVSIQGQDKTKKYSNTRCATHDNIEAHCMAQVDLSE